MGAIIDVLDLLKDLVNKAKDRKFVGELRHIQSMIGDIQYQQAELQERNIQLKADNEELKRTIKLLKEKVVAPKLEADLSHVANPTPTEALSDEEEHILKYLAQHEGAQLETISRAIFGDAVTTEYWLDKLQDRKMISIALALGRPGKFHLTRDGRDHLVENGLI